MWVTRPSSQNLYESLHFSKELFFWMEILVFVFLAAMEILVKGMFDNIKYSL